MLSMSPSQSKYERKMRRAKSHEAWLEAAHEHDTATGQDKWRQEQQSSKYDYLNIQSRVDELRKLRANRDDVGLLYALNQGIHGNQGGMGNSTLYNQSMVGTKKLMRLSTRSNISATCPNLTKSLTKTRLTFFTAPICALAVRH